MSLLVIIASRLERWVVEEGSIDCVMKVPRGGKTLVWLWIGSDCWTDVFTELRDVIAELTASMNFNKVLTYWSK